MGPPKWALHDSEAGARASLNNSLKRGLSSAAEIIEHELCGEHAK